MLYADKQHLKTEVAVDLLRVREKEMNFYATNLSMVGTQSALLAGFAFAILAQNDFMFAAGGFWPQAWRAALGLRPIEEEYRVMKGWTEEEVCQFFHVILTTIGMSIQLWTLYTCVLTNILGLSLALRGPEGSVDRAVRHMAEQNQLVMNRFGYGVIIFFVTIMLFSLMEYEIYVSIPVCCCVGLVFRRMILNIRSLVNAFWLDQDTIVTGQFLPGDKRAEARAAAKMRARTEARLRGESVESAERGVTEVGHMLTGRYDADGSLSQLPRAAARERFDALKASIGLAPKGAGRANRSAQVREWARRSSKKYRNQQLALEEMQAPSAVVDKLICKTQNPPGRGRRGSRGAGAGAACGRDEGGGGGGARPAALERSPSWRWSDAASPEAERECAASVVQAMARGVAARGGGRRSTCQQLLQAESALGTRLDQTSGLTPSPRRGFDSACRSAAGPLWRDSEPDASPPGGGEAPSARAVGGEGGSSQEYHEATLLHMSIFERLMGRLGGRYADAESVAAVQLQSRARGALARQRSRELRLSVATGVDGEPDTPGNHPASPLSERFPPPPLEEAPTAWHDLAALEARGRHAADTTRQAAENCLLGLGQALDVLDLPCDPRRRPPVAEPRDDVSFGGNSSRDSFGSPLRSPALPPAMPAYPSPPYVGGARGGRRGDGPPPSASVPHSQPHWTRGRDKAFAERSVTFGGRRIDMPGSSAQGESHRDGWAPGRASQQQVLEPSFSACSSCVDSQRTSSGRQGCASVAIDIPDGQGAQEDRRHPGLSLRLFQRT